MNKASVPSLANAPHLSHLDLRPLTAGEYAGIQLPLSDTRRTLVPRDEGLADDSRHSLPVLNPESHQPAMVARAEAMAERFRHDGLPLARLWENHAAFVSVGLNGKGKPGIWLVQKIH